MKKLGKKKLVCVVLAATVLVAICWGLWSAFVAPTRIAFVNYQAITLGQIAKANNSSFVKISDLSVEDFDKASSFDMVFVNGMGLRMTAGQRQKLVDAADRGTPVLTTSATNPDNLIVSVDSVDCVFLKQYLAGGGRTNYRNMLSYVRRYIDGKSLFTGDVGDPVAAHSSLLYHLDPARPGDEEQVFASVREYNDFLKSCGLYRENAPAVIVTGQMGVPDSLISRFEATGNNVYGVTSLQTFIRDGHADSLDIAAVINMAHGRLGDAVVSWLEANNVPLFAPLNVNRPYDEWMEDNTGMSGGFMSQSVVTPEIDGAIRTFSLFAHYQGDDGLAYVSAIPDRLDEYVETVNNYIRMRTMPNAEKKVAIFYFKGPGQNALIAEGMEVAPSLYNLLIALRNEGYDVGNLPASAAELEVMLAERGRVFGNYAVGAQRDFIDSADPEIVPREQYEEWIGRAMPAEMYAGIKAMDGNFPGHGLHTDDGDIALARLRFGNVVLIPQTAAGAGDDEFKIVHGAETAPPHAYVASYLWARYGFGADALIHFGAHGSLEFTPRKQVALSSRDWSDRLVGTMPHFYIYSTSNVGEAMMAKRRGYAGIINYLTPPFIESDVRGIYKDLAEAVAEYNSNPSDAVSMKVKRLTVKLGIHRELRLDSIMSRPYSDDDIARIESFAEELANEKITGCHYALGEPYTEGQIKSTVYAMTVDPIAYSLYALDRIRGRAPQDLMKHRSRFTRRYGTPARAIVDRAFGAEGAMSDAGICRLTGIGTAELAEARRMDSIISASKDVFSRMMVMGSSMTPDLPTAKISGRKAPARNKHSMMKMPGMNAEKALAMARKMGADDEALKKMEAAMKRSGSKSGNTSGKGMSMSMIRPDIPVAEREKAEAVMEVVRAVSNVNNYRNALRESPRAELKSVLNALTGGYIAPTSGGDPVLNPNILPTGRNMFAVNAEETPSVSAWEKGKSLADNTIAMYRKNHGDSIPRKVSYTLWSSEFIETEGATIAQVLYMLGVEPVRDAFGRVTDLRLIPSAELGRPRIDVVVQTSGQLRDLAASRLFFIDRAVKMAAAADDKDYPNYVADGVNASERHLVDRGVSPKEAREMSTARVFGGVNGNYGSGIQAMVEAGDRWEDEREIADTYINNMGAYYGSEEEWEAFRQYAFEAALVNTEVVVQPRQSNTWGALSLDHVYEFMGGMNLAVRNVTGRDPDAYLSDYRNRNNVRMQEVKEAIGIESRTTILNPAYIKEKMRGGSGDASVFADVVRNTYGWNVTKPDVIDNELWDDIYDTYVADKHNLGTKDFFTSKNPAALEEITAVMLETARKGLWEASDEQLKTLAELHTGIVNEYRPSCSGFVCDNAKLREFIAEKVDGKTAAEYKSAIGGIRAEAAGDEGMVMKKDELNTIERSTGVINGILVGVCVLLALVAMIVFIRRRRKTEQ